MEGRGKGRRGGDNLGVTRGGGVGKGVIKRGITYDMTESDPTGPLKAIKNPNTSFSLLIHEMGPLRSRRSLQGYLMGQKIKVLKK